MFFKPAHLIHLREAMPHDPVRRVIRRGHKGFVGLFPSRKSGRPLEFESLLERNFLCLMEVDPLVNSVRVQPREIRWTIDGTIHRHIPDFEIEYIRKLVVVEIKPDHKAAQPAFVQRTRIITSVLHKEGIAYRVLTETLICREPALSNAKILLRGLAHEPSPAERDAVTAMVAIAPQGLTIREICLRLSAPPEFANSIYAMVMSGEIVLADASAPVNTYSRVKARRYSGGHG